MKTYVRVEVWLHHSFPRHQMEVSGHHAPAALLPGKEPPGTHWIGGWVGPSPVWTIWRREESPALARNRTPAAQSVVHHCTD
jgi:hypothetical protein